MWRIGRVDTVIIFPLAFDQNCISSLTSDLSPKSVGQKILTKIQFVLENIFYNLSWLNKNH